MMRYPTGELLLPRGAKRRVAGANRHYHLFYPKRGEDDRQKSGLKAWLIRGGYLRNLPK
jgi:hypothetical protein